MADERFQSEELTRRRPGRPRSPVTTKPLSDERAYWRLRENRMHNSFAAIRVLAFCSVWQRNGGTIDGVVMSGYCGRRTVFYRLDSCHRAGFEPELVWWGLKTGKEWEEYEENFIRHMEDDLVAELDEYHRRSVVSRTLHRKPQPHPDLLEDTAE
jgi:FPC/CPF motif-containing protein YcgG